MEMAIPFVPAEDLKQNFDVYGHFYAIDVPGLEPSKCRSVLEIRSKMAHGNELADAVFVMMNPGSSRPLVEVDNQVASADISRLSDKLVPTAPDTTQYQVMRVMQALDWRYVRVINLSDLRDPKSRSFVDRYANFEKTPGAECHSIFSPARSKQLERCLSRKPRGPIVCAWGVSNDLAPLISRAKKALASGPDVTGLAKPGQPWKYFHPLPSIQYQKEQWVTKMVAKLRREKLKVS